jgi:hypothetical protein
MTIYLNGDEFVRRYLLHLTPKGFTRNRHYEFLADSCSKQRLAQIRVALTAEQAVTNKTNRSNGAPSVDVS